ncbi:hypothetical protein IP87_03605 [beta proteobacterium AAP121]|nr:hypothetical protein IP80_16890 [beta proteobacterium AAP65]KPG00131.1 hypothetical protein IP87_03605 [beta proteobacterium AAP121]
MRPGFSARLRAGTGRLLMRAATALLGHQGANWARAMQAEIDTIGHEPAGAPDAGREALGFAWGCFCTAAGHALAAAFAGLAQAHNAGLAACVTTVLLGCVFMLGAGAPSPYALMNLLSLALAVASFCLLPRQRLAQDEALRARLACALGALLLGAALAPTPAGASAWLKLGPVQLNLPWLLLPALLVAADVRAVPAARPWALGGLLMACGAFALLAEPVLAGLLAAVLSQRAWRRRSGALALLALAAWGTALHVRAAWQAPEAAPFVDQVLQHGLAQGLATGIALTGLQLLPLWPALRHRHARQHGLVWGLVVLCSLPGWLPSPLVGFGGSFIGAYLLSLALLPQDTQSRPLQARSFPRRPRTWPPANRRARLQPSR